MTRSKCLLIAVVSLAACGPAAAPEPELAAPDGVTVAPSALSTSFNGIRVAAAQYPIPRFLSDVPADFDSWLQQAQSEFYTHIAMPIDPTGWDAFQKVEDFKVPLQRAVAAVNARGMKVLPIVNIGSASASWWGRLTDPAVQMNRVRIPADQLWIVESPTFAADPNGMDAQFRRLMTVIRDGSKLTPGGAPLVDSVILSYDEFAIPYAADERDRFILAGGGTAGRGTTLAFSQRDRDFVNGYTGTTAAKFAALINTSLHRRMKTVQSVLGSQTKVLAYGDEWDPQATGGYRYHTFLSATGTAQLSPDLRALTGLTSSQRTELRNGVIFVPWNYASGWPNNTSSVDPEARYDAFAAMSAFDQAALKFVYAAGYDFNPLLACEASDAMQAYVRASRWFPNSSVGYMATWWALAPDAPGTINCSHPVANPREIRHELYVANANMPPDLRECPQHFEDHWFYPLTSTSAPWRLAWGNPLIQPSADRLALTFDDVVRRSPMDLGYSLTFTVKFNGDLALHPDVGIANLTKNYPAIRRVGSQLEVGGTRYGTSATWGTAGSFTGQRISSDTAKITVYVKSTSRQIAMRVESNGTVLKSGFIQYPTFDPAVVQLVGSNNTGNVAANMSIAPITGCGGVDDTWVTALYNQ